MMDEIFKYLEIVGLASAAGIILYGFCWSVIWIWKGIHSLDDKTHKKKAWCALTGLGVVFIIASSDGFSTVEEAAKLIAYTLGIIGILLLIDKISNTKPVNSKKSIGLFLWSIPIIGSAIIFYYLINVLMTPNYFQEFGAKNAWRIPVFAAGSGVLCLFSIYRFIQFFSKKENLDWYFF